jgi:hypothetical protein
VGFIQPEALAVMMPHFCCPYRDPKILQKIDKILRVIHAILLCSGTFIQRYQCYTMSGDRAWVVIWVDSTISVVLQSFRRQQSSIYEFQIIYYHFPG